MSPLLKIQKYVKHPEHTQQPTLIRFMETMLDSIF
ncbi:hypothetical protein DO64_5385 [Burkholderia pseudomallei]|nr:hypothetical protein DO64_5385 [Burkholderia pseudomallei]